MGSSDERDGNKQAVFGQAFGRVAGNVILAERACLSLGRR